MEKLFSKLKTLNNKKQIENIVIFIALLIIVIIVINSLFAETNKPIEDSEAINVSNSEVSNDDLEKKLKKILSVMNGVGSVDVMISYSNTIEQVPMYDLNENTTIVQEEDVNGGKRETKEVRNEQSIIFEEKNNAKIPAVKQTIMPEIIGVIIVADGAKNSVVKENIKNAVEAVVNIAPNHIQVFAK